MCTVVLGTTEGKPRRHPTFEAFARYRGFEPRLCRLYRAQTKGKVESGVKYVKRNFLPSRVFRDLDDFNVPLHGWPQAVVTVRVHGTTHQRLIDRFAEEAPALVARAGQPSFLDALVRERVVAEDWLVAIDSNRYSVPCRLIGKTVQVVRSGGVWQIHYRGDVVAEYAVLAGRHQVSIQPEHGRGACARNARQRYAEVSEWPQNPRSFLKSRCVIFRFTSKCWRLYEPDSTRTPIRASHQAAPLQRSGAA